MPKNLFVTRQSETKQVKEALINLARTWTQAASYRDHTKKPPRVRASYFSHLSEPGIAALMLHR
jgi:hypothetical protein